MITKIIWVHTSPHFNCFNEKGESVAYKTEQLKNEQERVALEDINLCMSHFCYESNIRLNDDEYPGISILSSTLQLPIIKDDPNSGVEFI